MKVNPTTSAPIQSTQTDVAKKLDKAKQAAKTNEAQELEKAKSNTVIPGSAKAEISTKARELANAKSVASLAPDVREEKIAELKKKIQSGQYKVDADAVADKLVDEHLRTAKAGLT